MSTILATLRQRMMPEDKWLDVSQEEYDSLFEELGKVSLVDEDGSVYVGNDRWININGDLIFKGKPVRIVEDE